MRFRVVFSQSFWLRVLPGGARLVQPRWMPERRILGGGRTCGVSFWPFPNSSGWWRLISSVLLTRTSSHKTTHANGYYGAWPGRAVSISVLPLTVLQCWGKTDRGVCVCVCVCVCYADRGRKQGPTFTRIICLSPLGRGDTSEDRKVTWTRLSLHLLVSPVPSLPLWTGNKCRELSGPGLSVAPAALKDSAVICNQESFQSWGWKRTPPPDTPPSGGDWYTVPRVIYF